MPLPQQQHAALQRQAGVPHHHAVQLAAELPVDLAGAVAGDVVPQLEGIGVIVARALLGIGVAVVADAGAQGQVHPQGQQIRLHRKLLRLGQGQRQADETQQIVDPRLFHRQAADATQGGRQGDARLSRAAGSRGKGQYRHGPLASAARGGCEAGAAARRFSPGRSARSPDGPRRSGARSAPV